MPKEQKLTKWQIIEHSCKELQTDISSKNLSVLTGFQPALIDSYLYRLHRDLKLLREGKGNYRWKELSNPLEPPTSKAAVSKNSNSKPNKKLSISGIQESLEWLFSYIKQLEDENQSLYEALCKYGNFATATRRRYEDRLHVIRLREKGEIDD